MKKFNTLVALIFTILLLAFTNATAQRSTGINNTNPSQKAALHIKTDGSFKQGIIIPKLAGADTATLNSPSLTVAEKGLIFYDTTNSVFQYWNGSRWYSLGGNAIEGWSLTGNALTNAATNFIGTTDNIDLAFRVNNTERMFLRSTGADVFQNLRVQGTLDNTDNQIRIHNNNSNTFFDYNGGSVNFRDEGAASSLFIEDATRNVGIGTTTPGAKLDVNGTEFVRGNSSVFGMSMLCQATLGAGSLLNNGQGSYVVWNHEPIVGYTNSGITNFVNHRGVGLGGFSWSNTNDMATFSNMMTLTASGVTNPSSTAYLGILTSNPESNLEVNGSFGKKVTSITGNTTLNDTHGTIVCNTNAATVTLPSAANSGARVYEIKRAVGNTNNITIIVAGGGTIDGATPYILSNAGQSVTVFSDGTNWLKRDGSNEAVTGNGWDLAGNALTNAASNFIGTTDNIDLVFRSNNAERMRILGSGANIGNVGIGTTVPQRKLEVLTAGASAFVRVSNNTTDFLDIGFNHTANAVDKYATIGTGSTTHTLCLQPNAGSLIVGTAHSIEGIANVLFSYPTWNANGFLLENGAGVSGSYTTIAPGYKGTTAINGDLTIRSVLRPAPQNPGTIWFGNTIAPTNDQIFNIGTSAERFGNAFISSTVHIGSTTNKSILNNNGTDSFFDFYGGNVWFRDQGAMNNLFLEDVTGNVGIGTGGPQQRLSVQGGMNIDQGNQNTGTGTITNFSLRFGSNSSEGIGSNRFGAGSNPLGLDFYTGSALRMVITNPGNVGIGTSTPANLLSVGATNQFQVNSTGNIVKINNVNTSFPATNSAGVLTNDGTGMLTWGAGGSGWNLTGNASTSPTTNFVGTTDLTSLVLRTNNNNRLKIDSVGNIGVGTNIANAKLHIKDNIAPGSSFDKGVFLDLVNSGNANYMSGIRLKVNNSTTNDRYTGAIFHRWLSGAPTTYQTIFAIRDNDGLNVSASDAIMTITKKNGGVSAVGIGTTTPATKLQVVGQANADTISANMKFRLGTVATAGQVLTTDASGYGSWQASGSSGWGLTGNALTTSSNFIGTIDVSDLAFRTGGVGSVFERMRILSTGNIGIGTNSPATILHIRQLGTPAISIQSGDYISTVGASISRINFADAIISAPNPQASIVAIRDAATVGVTDLPTALTFWTIKDGSSTLIERIRIDNAGNLGIGTSAPNQLSSTRALTISAASAYGTTLTASLELQGTSTSGNGEVNRIDFNTRGSSAIANLARISSNTSSGNTTYGQLVFYTRNATDLNEAMRIKETGQVIVGLCATPPTVANALLYVAGSLRASTLITTAALACSDIRYKKEINPLRHSLEKIMKLQGVNYFWKKEEFPDWKFSESKQIGFIAQDIEKIFPELVNTEHDSTRYKSVEYSKLTPILVEAIKEQQQIIDSLKQTNNQQDLQLQQLKGAIEDNKRQKDELKGVKTELEQLRYDLEQLKKMSFGEAKKE